MSKGLIAVIVVAILVLIGLKMTLFTVDETEQVIVTELGKFKREIKEPGLYFKVPFIQAVHRFEDRILEYDAAAAKILTKDKKYLLLDNYARWRITDPLKFYQTARNEVGAQARLDDIVFSEIREELGRHNFSEIITTQREAIMDEVGSVCREKAKEYGIPIIDVRIKRADLPKEVERSVYARMKAERARKAKKYRAEGDEQAVMIRAETDKQETVILAEAYEKAEKIKGEGDGQATKIYAEAYERDSEFYAFLRTLEAYRKSLAKDTTVILSSDSEFLQYLSQTESK